MTKKHNTQPQRPDIRGSDENIEIQEYGKYDRYNSVEVRFKLLVGAINAVRLTCANTELEQLMADILRAGGVLVDDDK